MVLVLVAIMAIMLILKMEIVKYFLEILIANNLNLMGAVEYVQIDIL
jgi:hypothetical protein